MTPHAHVWIGLCFFPGSWLWADGQLLSYKAWGQEGKPTCPKNKRKCAALQVMGGTQSNNGTDSTLGTKSAVGTGVVPTNDIVDFGVNTAAHNGLYIYEVSDAAADVKESVWEARDYEERLHFFCY